MDGQDEAALHANLSRLTEYLSQQPAERSNEDKHDTREGASKERAPLPPQSKTRTGLLQANRSSDAYLSNEGRVTPTRTQADDVVDRFSLPSTEESRRQKAKLLVDSQHAELARNLLHNKPDSLLANIERKTSSDSKRVTFASNENGEPSDFGEERANDTRGGQFKRQRLLNNDHGGIQNAEGGQEPRITDVFNHYDKLAADLRELYSTKLAAAREESRREHQRANDERRLREEVEAAFKQLEDELRYCKEELEEERRKAAERSAELRRVRREKLSSQRSDSCRISSDSRVPELDDVLAKCKDLTNQNHVLESTLMQVSKERDILKEEMLHLQATSNQTQAQLLASTAVKEELSTVLKDIQRDRVEVSILLQNLAQNKETIAMLTSKNDDLVAQLREFEEENAKLSEAMNEISHEVASVPLLRRQNQELAEALAVQEDKAKSNASKAESLEKQVKAYKDKVDTLLGLNDFMEKSLKEAEEKQKQGSHERHDEVDLMKDRVQQMINENLKLKRKVNELEGQLDLADVEAGQMKRRDDEQAEQISILHEDLMTVSNQLNLLESSHEKTKKENQATKKVLEQLEDELEASRAHEERASRAIKAYEILLSDIAKKVQGSGGPSLRIPSVNLERFNDLDHRDQFMANLCAFEDGVKVTLDRAKKGAYGGDAIAATMPLRKENDGGDHSEVVERLKSTALGVLCLLEDILEEPDRARDLQDLLSEYCVVRRELSLLERKALQADLNVSDAKDVRDNARRSKELNSAKASLQSMAQRVQSLEGRIEEALEDLRQQLQPLKTPDSQQDSMRFSYEQVAEVRRQRHPNLASKATNSSTKTRKTRQPFFKVSEVEDVISSLIDSKHY